MPNDLSDILYCFVCFQTPIYAAYLYDAVLQYARALNRTGIPSKTDGKEIVRDLMGRSFHSRFNFVIRIQQNCCKLVDYTCTLV